ncbi:hypothetical protein AB8O64_35375 [Streptomyces sp. QH1-20]
MGIDDRQAACLVRARGALDLAGCGVGGGGDGLASGEFARLG